MTGEIYGEDVDGPWCDGNKKNRIDQMKSPLNNRCNKKENNNSNSKLEIQLSKIKKDETIDIKTTYSYWVSEDADAGADGGGGDNCEAWVMRW